MCDRYCVYSLEWTEKQTPMTRKSEKQWDDRKALLPDISKSPVPLFDAFHRQPVK